MVFCQAGGEGRAHCVIERFNTLPATSLVGVLVLFCRIGIPDLDALNVHSVILRRRDGCNTPGPIGSSFRLVRVAAIPKAETGFHWCLGKVVAGFGSSKSAYCDSINGPDEGGGRPVKGKGVERVLRVCSRHIFSDVVVENAFAKVIGLCIVATSADHLPVDFIQNVRKKYQAADNAFALGRLSNEFNASEEELEACPHGRSVKTLCESQLCAFGAVGNCFVIG